jgi:hypothetical protein
MRGFLSLMAVGALTVMASAGPAFAEGQGAEHAADHSQAGGNGQAKGHSGDAGKSSSAPGQQQQPQSGTGTSQVATGGGANQSGPYDPSGVGLPSGNGKSDNNNGKRPCAGCVGKADAKNPPGQLPGGQDSNKGYECDENQGVGKTNPAHSGCSSSAPPPTTSKPPTTIRQPTPESKPAPGQGAVLGEEVAQAEQPEEEDEGEVARDRPEEAVPDVVSNPRRLPELPFTGLALLSMALLGVAMAALGLRTRQWTRLTR